LKELDREKYGDLLQFIRENRQKVESVLSMYTPDSVYRVRNAAARNGIEMTPSQVEEYFEELAVGLLMIQNEEGLSDQD
jgi:hypothetical protein